MATSPLPDSSSVVRVRVTSDGAEIASVQLASIEVRKGFNRISRAFIRVADGDMAAGTFTVADGAAFKPGAAIEISAGYDASTQRIFQGVVVRQGLSISLEGGALLEVECLDAIDAATVERRSAMFADRTDSDTIRAILSGYGAAVDVDATEVAHERRVQVDCTDWDYVLARAEANGLLVSMDDGKISVKAPRTDGEAVLKVTYGQDLIALRADQDLRRARGPATSRTRGQVRFAGTALARVGGLMELVGLGDRFSGNALITSVCHELQEGSWITEVEVGALPSGRPETHAPAAGPAAGGTGLQLGLVTKVDADPAGQFRVQISMPLSGAESAVLWARLSTVYATPGGGSFFPPEVGDEVVLGFAHGDMSQPIVLGSLWSAKAPPPRRPESTSSLKAIVSKSGLTIELDDARRVLTLQTPGGNTVVVSDDAKAILLKDQHGNQVAMNAAGLLLESAKDLQLKAAGAISLSAQGNVDIKAHADVSIEGLNVRQTAQVAFVAKGHASAELSASGQTVVKGALVMIN